MEQPPAGQYYPPHQPSYDQGMMNGMPPQPQQQHPHHGPMGGPPPPPFHHQPQPGYQHPGYQQPGYQQPGYGAQAPIHPYQQGTPVYTGAEPVPYPGYGVSEPYGEPELQDHHDVRSTFVDPDAETDVVSSGYATLVLKRPQDERMKVKYRVIVAADDSNAMDYKDEFKVCRGEQKVLMLPPGVYHLTFSRHTRYHKGKKAAGFGSINDIKRKDSLEVTLSPESRVDVLIRYDKEKHFDFQFSTELHGGKFRQNARLSSSSDD